MLIFLTEWNEFTHLDFEKIKGMMKTPYIIDGRNFLNMEKLKKMGFVYKGIGRN